LVPGLRSGLGRLRKFLRSQWLQRCGPGVTI